MKKWLVAVLYFFVFTGALPLSPLAATWEDMLETNDGEYRYSINVDNSVTLERYLGESKTVITPTEINDKPVTAIGDSCFAYSLEMREIRISEGVTHLGKNALEVKWNYLVAGTPKPLLSLPSTLKTVDDYCFREAGFEQVIFPDGVESVGSNAFTYSFIRRVYIPASVTEIGSYLFLAASGSPQIYTDEASYAEEYAKKNEIRYEIGTLEEELEVPSETVYDLPIFDDIKEYVALDLSKMPTSQNNMNAMYIWIFLSAAMLAAMITALFIALYKDRKAG